ncbi:MAG TPA: hypothetical protein VK034_21450 [Enhygromyxa sp.]|nr:hypothetical protein [Enhygromyxa sp.]
MRLEELASLLERTVEDFRRSPTHWQFAHQDIPMACLVDPNFDRMRFIAPIVEVGSLDDATKDAVLEANFHTALDARYASSNGLLFAAFIHPLSSLDEPLARSALDQVASLVHTFGTQYSSGSLEFVGGSDDEFGDLDELEDEDEDDEGPLWN